MPMARTPRLLLFLAFALATTLAVTSPPAPASAPAPAPAAAARTSPSDFPALDFEGGTAKTLPPGWKGGPSGSGFTDDKVFHGGAGSIRIERDDKSDGEFSAINATIPMDFAGTTIELRGWLRTENVDGRAGLWLREDGESGMVAFDNMAATPLSGTKDWAEYSIRLPVDSNGRQLVFGALLIGKG